MKINVKWHDKNKMSKRPTLEERVTWHLVRSKNKEEVNKYEIK